MPPEREARAFALSGETPLGTAGQPAEQVRLKRFCVGGLCGTGVSRQVTRARGASRYQNAPLGDARYDVAGNRIGTLHF